jgi:ABC-type dipeptide/oligopeptide/nickel transport system permease subunit
MKRLVVFWIAFIAVGPVLTTVDPMRTDTAAVFRAPDWNHPLGTDGLGRDVLSRMLHGGQRSLLVALIATGVAWVPGLIGGILATTHLERPILVLTDALLAFPSLLLALVVMTLLGRGSTAVAAAVGLAQVAICVRIVRAAIIAVQSAGYIESALAAGASRYWLLRHHLLPGIQPMLAAHLGVLFSYCLLNSAALSFLGLSGEVGMPDWGVMLAEGRAALRAAPWVALAPGIGITITVMVVNNGIDTLVHQLTRS